MVDIAEHYRELDIGSVEPPEYCESSLASIATNRRRYMVTDLSAPLVVIDRCAATPSSVLEEQRSESTKLKRPQYFSLLMESGRRVEQYIAALERERGQGATIATADSELGELEATLVAASARIRALRGYSEEPVGNAEYVVRTQDWNQVGDMLRCLLDGRIPHRLLGFGCVTVTSHGIAYLKTQGYAVECIDFARLLKDRDARAAYAALAANHLGLKD